MRKAVMFARGSATKFQARLLTLTLAFASSGAEVSGSYAKLSIAMFSCPWLLESNLQFLQKLRHEHMF